MQPLRVQSRQADHRGVRATLRASTSGVHERLHEARSFAALAEGRLDRHGYADLLIRLHAFHRAVDPAVVSARRVLGMTDVPAGGTRVARLEADLAHLGGAPYRRIAMPAWEAEVAVGCLYVVEGSMLGGKLIHRQLDYLFGANEAGRSFFGGGAGDGGRWRELCDRLESYGATAERLGRMTQGAASAFALFQACLEEAA
jgi:heme oxygenase